LSRIATVTLFPAVRRIPVDSIRIALATIENGATVKLDQFGIFHGGRLKIPAIRRYQPRPAQDLVFPEHLQFQRRANQRRHLHRHPAIAQQVKLVRRLTLLKQSLTRADMPFGSEFTQNLNEVLVQSREEIMGG
jgi:hypothetical protein